MKQFKKAAAFLCAGVLALGSVPAMAETTFEGSVVSGRSVSITAPFGGTVSAFSLREGSRIGVGDAIADIETTKVYASADGVVAGVFGQEGDSVEDVTARYGTVLYIAPESKYTIAGDIEKAYNSSETSYVNISEAVYMVCTTDGKHTATGVITAVSGTGYTVETTSGELLMNETVYIYRGDEAVAQNRIGRGTVSRTSEIKVSGSGSILKMHVQQGDTVKRGDLLFETVTGTLDGLYAVSNTIVSGVSGIVASVDTADGGSVQKDQSLITVYPSDAMQVEIAISEYDLSTIAEGDRVQIGFNWDETSERLYEGTVSMISYVSASQDGEASYKGYVDFVPDENVRLGMTVVVYTIDEEEAPQETLDVTGEPDGAAPEEQTGELTGFMPEGAPDQEALPGRMGERPEKGERPNGVD